MVIYDFLLGVTAVIVLFSSGCLGVPGSIRCWQQYRLGDGLEPKPYEPEPIVMQFDNTNSSSSSNNNNNNDRASVPDGRVYGEERNDCDECAAIRIFTSKGFVCTYTCVGYPESKKVKFEGCIEDRGDYACYCGGASLDEPPLCNMVICSVEGFVSIGPYIPFELDEDEHRLKNTENHINQSENVTSSPTNDNPATSPDKSCCGYMLKSFQNIILSSLVLVQLFFK